MNFIKEINSLKIGKIEQNVFLNKNTSFKIGGKTDYLIHPKNVEKLIELIKTLKKHNIKYKIIGNGSNLIFSDNDYKGVIIKLNNLNKLEIKDRIIEVESGYNLMKLADVVSKKGLTGLEFATGIPGTVGGAIFMNAGAYNFDMGYIVNEVKVLTENLKIKTLYNRDMKFKYRTSLLQENKSYICLSVKLVLKLGKKDEIMKLIEERRQRRIISQPLEYPSAGSVFRNPTNDYAGRLIEACGLKNHKIGGACVSEKHANFIINIDNAKSSDVKDLIDLIKKEVKNKFNIDLKEEQEFVNWE